MAKYALSKRPRSRFAIALIASALVLATLPFAAAAQDTSTASAGGAFSVGSGGKGSDATNQGGAGYTPAPSANSPTDDQYVDLRTRIQTSTSSDPRAASGGLPFTGFDIGIVALVGATLLGLGLTIRRLGAHDA